MLHGINAVELQTPKSFVDKQIKDKEHESADPRFVQSAQMLVAEKVTLPVEAATVLSRFYGVPLQRSMPLQFKYISCRGDLNTILLTSEMKPVKLTAADFEIPKGYKTVTDFSKLEDRPIIKGPPSRKIIETIKSLKKNENKTIIMITHNLEEVVFSDRVIVLNDGKIALDGTPREVLSRRQILEESGLAVIDSIQLISEIEQSCLPNKEALVEALWELTFAM